MPTDGEFAAIARMLALTANDDGYNSNHFALQLIRESTKHKPDWVQPSPTVAARSDRELYLRVVNWLAEEGILKVRDGNVQLTAEGRRTLAAATSSDELLSEFLGGRKNSLDRCEANHTMLLILCTHFELRDQKNETDHC